MSITYFSLGDLLWAIYASWGYPFAYFSFRPIIYHLTIRLALYPIIGEKTLCPGLVILSCYLLTVIGNDVRLSQTSGSVLVYCSINRRDEYLLRYTRSIFWFNYHYRSKSHYCKRPHCLSPGLDAVSKRLSELNLTRLSFFTFRSYAGPTLFLVSFTEYRITGTYF